MKKNHKLIGASILSILLCGCGGYFDTPPSYSVENSSMDSSFKDDSTSASGNSAISFDSNSVSSSPSIDPNRIPFSEIDSILNGALREEVYGTSSVEIKNTTSINDRKMISSEVFKMFEDGTSNSEGTLTEMSGATKGKEDTFSRRTQLLKEKIEVEGTVQDYEMFTRVTDYHNDTFSTQMAYQDTAEKVYVVASDQIASDAGLAEGQYILKSDIFTESCSQQISALYQFIGGNLMANVYVSQLDIDSFHREILADKTVYTCVASYELGGDLNDTITTTIDVSFTLNSEGTRLLETTYFLLSEDVSNINITDKYVSLQKTEVVFNYGAREESYEGTLNVEDFFLQTVSDVEIIKTDTSGNRVPCNPNAFPISSEHLLAKAKAYTPSKALGLSLYNVSSSDESVISLSSSGTFDVLKTGKTTLRFGYYGKDSTGVYKEMFIEKEVIVVDATVERITLLFGTSEIENDTLELNKTYKIGVYVSPKQAAQDVTVSVEDETIIEARVVDGNVEVKGLKSGETTITVASVVDPTITVSKTLYVAADLDYKEVISTKTYKHVSPYNYTFTMTFGMDGKGTRRQTADGVDIVDTFTYSVNGIRIRFTSWSSETAEMYRFDEAVITKNGKEIAAYVDSTYATYDFVAIGE